LSNEKHKMNTGKPGMNTSFETSKTTTTNT